MILVSKLGLFSSNETVDDVSTINLKYILVPFYLGELTEKLAKEDRIEILKMSQAQLKEFTSICEALELVSEEEIESSKPGSTDLAAARSKKIARFKRQRAAKAKLQEIKERKERRGRSSRASALSAPIEAGEEDLLDVDGEERETWLTAISLAICKAFDLLDMLKKEEQMLVALKEQSLQDAHHEHRRSWLKRDGDHEQLARKEHKTHGGGQLFLAWRSDRPSRKW